MEYAEFGLYKMTKALEFEDILNKDYNSKSIPERESNGKMNKINTSNGILTQIYEDLKSIILYLESVGEMLDTRVIM